MSHYANTNFPLNQNLPRSLITFASLSLSPPPSPPPYSSTPFSMLDSELCHSTLKPNGDKEDILKSFITFDITPHGPVLE